MKPAIDLAAAGIDFGRLERSLQLSGDLVGTGQYRVTGGEHEHWVDLYTTGHPRCDCGDHLWRDQVCKHILAALLREGNGDVIHAVGGLVTQLRQPA